MRKNFSWLWLALIIIVLDQATKWYFSATMQLGDSINLLPGFNWTLAHNYGAAFSFLHDAGGWQRWFFAGIALVVSGGILFWLRSVPANARFLACALVLVLGGALGNLYDRMMLGYVVDFVHVYYGTWHFPAFNIADAGITVGAIMLIIDSLFLEKKREVAND
ncbi:MAG: signal peptidase II [Moraxellaceae bacterium]|nr:signal peptidase II [Moraxellaceae bacterium]MBP9046315.1 signal peptidase II [Moraxellaceae bacterium]MBP9731420.1 signal peptidase II [Moraxellaceae bacterium]MCC6201336.1 signal peptidase II [Moraxellaceae bacterium]